MEAENTIGTRQAHVAMKAGTLPNIEKKHTHTGRPEHAVAKPRSKTD